MDGLYDMIFKRKSIRRFDDSLHVSQQEMRQIRQRLELLIPLNKEICVRFQIVPKAETTSKRGEYCLLLYSERAEGFLLNAGYLLEQMDLYLASLDIGVCWYGMAKAKEPECGGLPYVIMLAFGKSRPQDFRNDFRKCKRKGCEDIWNGDFDKDVVNLVRFAPSSCNMQPWRVKSDENRIAVYRTTEVRSIMPVSKRPFYNSIDMGVFLCFLELVLRHQGHRFKRSLAAGETETAAGDVKVAEYTFLGRQER